MNKVNPSDINLAWLMENRARVAEALNIVEALKAARVVTGGSGGKVGIEWNGTTITISIP